MKETSSTEKTIAVLPFANFSKSEEMEYFSDGITEEIINALARIKQIKVTSRTSSFYFKNKQVPIHQIANELNVAVILEGSVRLAANTVRITAQLIDAKDDFHFWTETWDRKLENIFEIQDEISLNIAEKLREQYGHFEIQEHLVEKKTNSIDAYEYSLKAKYHFNKWNPVDIQIAIENYEKAIAIDPKHTDAYIGLADAYSFFAVTELMPAKKAWEKSRSYTDLAYALDSKNAGVHYLLANIAFFYRSNFQESMKHTINAIELMPNYPEAQQFMSFLYIISGETNKAKAHLDIAYRVDPLSQETLFYKAYFQYRKENYTEALSLYDIILDKNPHNIPVYFVRSYCLIKMGRCDEAIDFITNMPKEIVVDNEQLGTLCLAYLYKNDDANFQKHFELLYHEAQNPTSFQAHSYLYLIYASMGKTEEAFAWLQDALKLKSSVLLLSFSDPLAAKLKSDPRYQSFKNQLYGQTEPETEKAKTKTKTRTALLDLQTANQYSDKLQTFIEEEAPYLIPNLSLRMLAEQLEIHPNKLSWLLNERMGKNFNEFINHYRIEYFKKLAIDPSNSHISLIGLAYESGFNSKTVFNTYFKKETGLTPKEFISQNRIK